MTTLSNALNTATRGLGVASESISIASHNIANANTPDYVTQKTQQGTVVTNGVGQGAQINGVFANVDEQLLLAIRNQSSSVGEANTVKQFYDNVQQLFGTPGSDGTLNARVDQFFTAFQLLSDNPSQVSLREGALRSAKTLVEEISGLSKDLNNLRLEADKQISNDVKAINSLLTQLSDTNAQVGQFGENSSGRLQLEQERSSLLRQLSGFIDIDIVVDNFAKISVQAGNGVALLNEDRFQLSYSAVASTDVFIEDLALNPLEVNAVNSDGTIKSKVPDQLATGGKSSAVVTNFNEGELKGLLKLRDSEIPKFIAQLDQLAITVRNQVNKLHNDGTSFPPPQSLIGTESITSTTTLGLSGKVQLAVVSSDGTPPLSPYPNEQFARPLTLDLGALNSGSGAGKPTIQTIVDEINEYYGPPQPRAQVGDLQDIRLAVSSNTVAAGGLFTFDFELDSVAKEDATFKVTSVTSTDPGVVFGAIPTNLSTGLTVAGGERFRTTAKNASDSISADLSAAAAGPYIFTASVEVTNKDGTVTQADISFEVQGDGTEDRNDRFYSTGVTQTSGTGAAAQQVSPSSQRLLLASIVDANGAPVAAGVSGFLKIEATSSSYGIAIDELDSLENGNNGTGVPATNRGFSHYFELNNFFKENASGKSDAAKLALSDRIASNANNIAVGSLTLSTQPADTTKALYTYELGSGNSDNARAIAKIDEQRFVFEGVGGLATTTTSLTGYTANIISFAATEANALTSRQDLENLALSGLQELFQEGAGVDTDKELALVIQLENNFRASSQIITVVRSLFDTLASVFR